MEPLFFKAENPNGAIAPNSSTQGASMEPLFFKAENRSGCWPCGGIVASFNGAAFFQSGKLRHVDAVLYREPSFNGAAFFQSGKCAPAAKRARWDAIAASMEPLFFKAENSPSDTMQISARYASMEPLFFKAENPA